MREQVTGKSLNLTFEMGSGGVIALRMVDDAGRALDMAGVTPYGEIDDEHTVEKLADLGCSWGARGEILVNFPAMERGRYVFHVFLRNDDGADVVCVCGYVGYSAPKELREESDIAAVNRTLRVVVGGDRARALWSRTSAAEQAYNKTKAAQESIAEDIEALKGAKEVVEKLHGEIADAVLIDTEGHWVIGGVDTFKPSRGERGDNGMDADTVKRVELASVEELPVRGDGRHIYYVSNGTPATGWVSGGDVDWYEHQITVHVASEEFSTEEGESVMLLVARINAGSELVTADFDGVKLHLTAKLGGAQGNQLGLTATSTYGELSQSGVFLSGGVDHTRYDVYIWGETVTGEEEWINVGSDPSNLKFATHSVAGVVLLSSPTVDSTLGGGIHRDAQGKIRVDDATTTKKGAVRLTAGASVGTFEECIGATSEPAGSGIGVGIGVLRSTATLYGVVKQVASVGEQTDSVPTCAAVNTFAHTAAQGEIAAYVSEAGETGNALSALIAQKVQEAMTTAGVVPAGAEMDFAGETAPEGWIVCDGREVSRADYAALFTVIGTRYGAGDGSTTFNVPDRRDLVTIMPTTLGQTGGRALGSIQEAYAPNITGRFLCEDWATGKTVAYWLNNTAFKDVTSEESQHEGCFMGVMYRGAGYTPSAYQQGLIASADGARFKVMDTAQNFMLYDVGSNVTSLSPSGNYGATAACRMTFSAARSSSVYKDGVTTLMPKNAAVLKIIKA